MGISREKIELLKVGEYMTLESNGNIVKGPWDDIVYKLEGVFPEIHDKWDNPKFNGITLSLGIKEFNLWHGNTKWFSLTRIK